MSRRRQKRKPRKVRPYFPLGSWRSEMLVLLSLTSECLKTEIWVLLSATAECLKTDKSKCHYPVKKKMSDKAES